MKRGEGCSTAAVVIALMLSGFLAFMLSANAQSRVTHILLLLRQSVTVKAPIECQSSFTGATAANGL